MALSSSTLFHFTKDLQTLQLILDSLSFWPRYSEEYCWKIRLAVPMCCFCDIPLSQIGNHMKIYGCYGIGLSKDWAFKNKQINPVFYITKEFLSYFNMLTKNDGIPSQDKIRKIITRIKPCVGKNNRKFSNGEIIQYTEYLFYNEREWRYIPDSLDIKNQCVKLKDKTNLEDLNKLTNCDKCKLKFQYNDIKYLFVKTEDERLQLINFICNKFNKKIGEKELLLLTSKILTEEQITNDF